MNHASPRADTSRTAHGARHAAIPWRACWLSLGINALLFLLFFARCTPIFSSSDDPSMMKIAGGAATGSPDAHLIFMNILLGDLFKWAFTRAPHVNWYALFQYAVLFLSYTTLCFCLLRLRCTWKAVMVYLLLFVGLGLYFLENPQFTDTAFLIGMSGLCLAVTAGTSSTRSAIGGMTFAALCIILAGMIRFSSLYLLLLVSAPLLGYALYQTRSMRLALTIGLALLGFAIVKCYDSYQYAHTPGWSDYFAYQTDKSLLYDYPGLRGAAYTGPGGVYWDANRHDPRVQRALTQVGWSRNDAMMFLGLLSPQDSTFSLAHLHLLTHRIPRVRHDNLSWYFHAAFSVVEVFIVLAILGIALPLLTRRYRCLLMANTLLVFGVFMYLILFAKFPMYLEMPMLYYLCVLSVLCVFAQSVLFAGMPVSRWLAAPSSDWRRTCVLCGAFASALLIMAGQWNFWKADRLNIQSRRAYNDLQTYLLSHEDHLYVATVTASCDQWMSPFADLAPLRKLQIIRSGWSAGSPLANAELPAQTQNPYLPLYQQANCYLMSDQVSAEIIKQYLSEHLGVRVNYTCAYTFARNIGDDTFTAGFYQFQRVH